MPHHLDYPAAVRRDGLGLADAAEAAGPAAPIPGCPGWDVAELVWHLTEVQYFWAEIVARRLQDPEAVARLERPEGFPALLARCRSGVEHLASTLAAADPATPVWTWARRKDAGFVIRHQAQEAAVHRWDAEHAAGRAFSIEPDLAADSIDEFLEHTAAWRNEGAAARRRHGPSPRHRRRRGMDDLRGRRRGPGGSTAATPRATAALRGRASDLLLILYRRLGPEAAEAFGDAGVLERFLARPNLG